MSVLFLPPSAGAASVPDATETVSGKIRIATSAEATAGTNDLTAMTPAKTKSVVDAAVVGGVTYQGTFDASSPADLSNATKGDLYIISVAGTYQGQTWAVGDHLLINADMGGTLDPAKIDKVDNTDSVTSVAGRTGAVTLSTADISGLATVASTGAYSDLSGTPTLATVATTGAYSDLSGTPTLGTASAEDVGTSAGNVVQLDGTAKLPAVDGSQLTNLPNGTLFYKTQITTLGATLTQITDNRRQHYDIALAGSSNPITLPSATSAAIGGVVSFFNSQITGQAVINCPTVRLLSGSSVTSFTVEVSEARSFVWVGASSLQEITATRLESFNGVSISSPSNGEALVYNGTSGEWENSTVSASVAALDDIGDVSAAAPSNTNVIKYNSTSGDWESGAVAYSEVTGTPTLATVATTGAYSDLTGTPTLGTASAEDVGTSAGNVVQLDGTAKLPAVDGSQLTNLPSASVAALDDIGDVTITSVADGQFLKYDSGSSAWVNADSELYEAVTFNTTSTMTAPSEPKTLSVALTGSLSTRTLTLYSAVTGLTGTIINLSNYGSVDFNVTTQGSQNIRGLLGTVTSFTLKPNQTAILTQAQGASFFLVAYEEQGIDSLADVDVSGAVATNVLKYDGTDWVDGAVAYSEVTGTPTLATVATTGAYSDLTGTPTLGTAAALDVGTSATNVVQLDGSARLPAVDGSQLTNLPGSPKPTVTVSSPSADQTLSAPSANEEAYIYTPTTPITVNLVAAATCTSGFKYQIKNRSTNAITIDPNGSETIDGASTFGLTAQEASVTLITDGSNWFII
jgi:hypothetical protein